MRVQFGSPFRKVTREGIIEVSDLMANLELRLRENRYYEISTDN